tara:strand:- start:942 stop:2846 length:1905 start_codon:yes stop_codon:yes gene_type:complete
MYKEGKFLSKIDSPSDLREFSLEDLNGVCSDLRNYIISIVSEKGGHLGASLGVVELTVALHYVFNTPYDLLVWDVGHQAYGHKILTKRKKIFHTNREYKGISGFPKITESEYDTFGVGHSSTSISALIGMERASKLDNSNKKHVAVIGDGALTAGLAFEGLNNAGGINSDITIILNDNCMSIDPNVGALKSYLTDISVSKSYNKIKNEVWGLLNKANTFGGKRIQSLIKKIDNSFKSILLQNSNYFESLNFRYFGPIDGHDVKRLVKVLDEIKDIEGPKILHVLTKKGKGYLPAEEGDPTKWHAPGLFEKDTGKMVVKKQKNKLTKYQDVFGHTIVELAKKNKNIIGVTPAMPTGCSLKYMLKEIPDRSFDVGIAEQHAVTFSAGLATQGKIPFCNIYSSFMQRAYDQVIHDVAIQNLPVVFCLDRGGLAGADGATHHGVFDLAYLRCIPNIIISAPINEIELRNLMYTAQKNIKHPFFIRYPRGEGVIKDWRKQFIEIEIGKGEIICDGEEIAVLSIGHPGNFVIEAFKILNNKNIFPAHFNMRFVKPLDEELLHDICKKFKFILTIEDGCIKGGFGSSILEFLAKNNYSNKVIILGVPDNFINHGTQKELYKECGFDVLSIVNQIESIKEVL